MNKLFLSLSVIVFLFSCNSNQKSANADEVKPLFEISKPALKEEIKAQKFTVNLDEGIILKTRKKSLISIPKDAFVFEDGSSLSVGDMVDIDYEEFNKPAEIITSGIPMTVMLNEEPVPFISDGMFNISAKCKGRSLKINKTKEVAVFTESAKKDPSFKYWYFNKTKGSWDNLGNRKKTLTNKEVEEEVKSTNRQAFEKASVDVKSTFVSSAKNKTTKIQAVTKPTPPISIGPNDFTFNISNTGLKDSKLEIYTNMIWKPEANLNKKQQATFVKDIENPKARLSIKCLDENDQLFQLNYLGSKSIKMRPVLLGKSKEKAKARFRTKLKAYKKAEEEREKQKMRQVNEAKNSQKVYNYFSVKKMGIYNCDRYYNYKGSKKDYVFKNKGKKVLNYVYAVLKGGTGVIALSAAYLKKGKFNLPKNDISGFIYTSPEGQLLKAVDEGMEETGDTELDFTLYNPVSSAESIDDLVSTFE